MLMPCAQRLRGRVFKSVETLLDERWSGIVSGVEAPVRWEWRAGYVVEERVGW